MRRVRLFCPEIDYPDLCKWWEGHGWPIIPMKFLSSFGMLAEEETGLKLACGFLFLTTSKFAWMEWMTTNPEAPLRAKTDGLSLLVDRLLSEADILKSDCVVSWITSRGLEKLYKKHGFTVGDRNMTSMLYSFPREG